MTHGEWVWWWFVNTSCVCWCERKRAYVRFPPNIMRVRQTRCPDGETGMAFDARPFLSPFSHALFTWITLFTILAPGSLAFSLMMCFHTSVINSHSHAPAMLRASLSHTRSLLSAFSVVNGTSTEEFITLTPFARRMLAGSLFRKSGVRADLALSTVGVNIQLYPVQVSVFRMRFFMCVCACLCVGV